MWQTSFCAHGWPSARRQQVGLAENKVHEVLRKVWPDVPAFPSLCRIGSLARHVRRLRIIHFLHKFDGDCSNDEDAATAFPDRSWAFLPSTYNSSCQLPRGRSLLGLHPRLSRWHIPGRSAP